MAKKVQKRQQQIKSSIVPMIMIGLGALLFVAFLVWAAVNSERNVATTAQGPNPGITRVSLGDSKAALDQNSAVFVDVRDAASFAAGHIPGALNIPVADIQRRSGELDPAAWIITYCTWPAEESSARAAQLLIDQGFQNVQPILGGYAAWSDAGYPVER